MRDGAGGAGCTQPCVFTVGSALGPAGRLTPCPCSPWGFPMGNAASCSRLGQRSGSGGVPPGLQPWGCAHFQVLWGLSVC